VLLVLQSGVDVMEVLCCQRPRQSTWRLWKTRVLFARGRRAAARYLVGVVCSPLTDVYLYFRLPNGVVSGVTRAEAFTGLQISASSYAGVGKNVLLIRWNIESINKSSCNLVFFWADPSWKQ